MNQNPIDRTRFEAIEAYVLGSMSAAEREAFDQELTKDVTLRAEVNCSVRIRWPLSSVEWSVC